MQVSSRVILSSAEGILRDRRGDNHPATGLSGPSDASARRSPETLLRQDALNARILDLQAQLNRTQSQYSREQARHAYLTRFSGEISSSLVYDGEPLFPELANGRLPSGLLPETQERLSVLTRSLKTAQVEMENMLALSFGARVPLAAEASELLRAGGLRDLDPERVAKLTRS